MCHQGCAEEMSVHCCGQFTASRHPGDLGHFCTVHLGMSATNVDDVCVLYLPRFSSFLPQPIRVHVHQEVICLDQFLALRLSQFCEEVE